ncbi:MAG: PfkB family carbohydrate kinase [Candidatus Omnitrophota bacterium]
MSVLVVGSIALDTIKTPFSQGKDILGGSAAYFSASSAFFSLVQLVAVVGEDFPEKYITLFKDRGIDLEGLTIEKGRTFRWEGEYCRDFSDPKTIATHLNVFADFKPKIPKSYKNTKHVFLANIDPKIQEQVLSQVTKPKLVACDTMNYWIENKQKSLLKLLKKVDIFFLNGSEAKGLTGEVNLIKAGKKIIKLGPKAVIIKKGEHGSLLFSENDTFAAPAFLLESIYDPTGAGDTFAGGFMGYLAKCGKYNKTALRNAVIYGTIMATFAVESFSLKRLYSITDKDINKRIKKFKESTFF